MPLYCNCTCKSSSTLRNSNIFRNLISSSTKLSNFFKLKTLCKWFNLDRLLLYHVVEMLKIYLGRIFFWKDCELFAVLVTKMVYLEVFEDKRWVQDSSTTVAYIFHIAVPPGNKTSWRRRNDVSLYVPATLQVRFKWNTRLKRTSPRRPSGMSSRRLIGMS